MQAVAEGAVQGGQQDERKDVDCGGQVPGGIALLPAYAVVAPLRDGKLMRVLDRFTIPEVWIKAWVPAERARMVDALLAAPATPETSGVILALARTPLPDWAKAAIAC